MGDINNSFDFLFKVCILGRTKHRRRERSDRPNLERLSLLVILESENRTSPFRMSLATRSLGYNEYLFFLLETVRPVVAP